jgi:hypothetical protein
MSITHVDCASKNQIHHSTKAKTPHSPATIDKKPPRMGNVDAAPVAAAGEIDGEIPVLLLYGLPAPEGEGDPAPRTIPGIEEAGVPTPALETPGAAEPAAGAEEPVVPAEATGGAAKSGVPAPGAAPPVGAGIGVVSVAVTGEPPGPHEGQTATVVVIPGPTPPADMSWQGHVAVTVCVVGPRPPVQPVPPVQKPGQTVT